MIKNSDESVEISHIPNLSHIPDHPYRILIAGCSGSGKNNALLKFIEFKGIDDVYENLEGCIKRKENKRKKKKKEK